MDGKKTMSARAVALWLLLQYWGERMTQAVSKRWKARQLTMLRPAGGAERGDVPGWVLITLMTAILVAGLLAVARPALEGLLDRAMSLVNQ